MNKRNESCGDASENYNPQLPSITENQKVKTLPFIVPPNPKTASTELVEEEEDFKIEDPKVINVETRKTAYFLKRSIEIESIRAIASVIAKHLMPIIPLENRQNFVEQKLTKDWAFQKLLNPYGEINKPKQKEHSFTNLLQTEFDWLLEITFSEIHELFINGKAAEISFKYKAKATLEQYEDINDPSLELVKKIYEGSVIINNKIFSLGKDLDVLALLKESCLQNTVKAIEHLEVFRQAYLFSGKSPSFKQIIGNDNILKTPCCATVQKLLNLIFNPEKFFRLITATDVETWYEYDSTLRPGDYCYLDKSSRRRGKNNQKTITVYLFKFTKPMKTNDYQIFNEDNLETTPYNEAVQISQKFSPLTAYIFVCLLIYIYKISLQSKSDWKNLVIDILEFAKDIKLYSTNTKAYPEKEQIRDLIEHLKILQSITFKVVVGTKNFESEAPRILSDRLFTVYYDSAINKDNPELGSRYVVIHPGNYYNQLSREAENKGNNNFPESVIAQSINLTQYVELDQALLQLTPRKNKQKDLKFALGLNIPLLLKQKNAKSQQKNNQINIGEILTKCGYSENRLKGLDQQNPEIKDPKGLTKRDLFNLKEDFFNSLMVLQTLGYVFDLEDIPTYLIPEKFREQLGKDTIAEPPQNCRLNPLMELRQYSIKFTQPFQTSWDYDTSKHLHTRNIMLGAASIQESIDELSKDSEVTEKCPEALNDIAEALNVVINRTQQIRDKILSNTESTEVETTPKTTPTTKRKKRVDPRDSLTGNLIREKRLAMSKGQKELSELLKVSVKTVSTWESAKDKKPQITVENAEKLKKILGID